jgi:hypothetical protein
MKRQMFTVNHQHFVCDSWTRAERIDLISAMEKIYQKSKNPIDAWKAIELLYANDDETGKSSTSEMPDWLSKYMRECAVNIGQLHVNSVDMKREDLHRAIFRALGFELDNRRDAFKDNFKTSKHMRAIEAYVEAGGADENGQSDIVAEETGRKFGVDKRTIRNWMEKLPHVKRDAIAFRKARLSGSKPT